VNRKTKNPSSPIRLTDAPVDVPLLIASLLIGEEAKRRLLAMGLHPGDQLKRVAAGNWGPVLIANLSTRSTKVAIGRTLARRILVTCESTGA
jgi:Fe2+ transport system protein FeoA